MNDRSTLRFIRIRLLVILTALFAVGGGVSGCGKRGGASNGDDSNTTQDTNDQHDDDAGKGDPGNVVDAGDTATADTAPPDIATVSALGHTVVQVVFSEAVSGATVTAGAFDVQGASTTVAVQAAQLGGDGRTVLLTVAAGMQHGTSYTLLVESVSDLQGNAIVSATKNFAGRGAVVAELSGGPTALTNAAAETGWRRAA